MKKLLAYTALALAVSSAPAMADDHKGGDKGGKMFEKHDTNGDGVISKDEFLAHAEERFGKMDADGNGEVSQDEAKAAHEDMKSKMKDRMKERKERREERKEEAAE